MKLMISRDQIQGQVSVMADQINWHYKDLERPLVLLVVLDGAMVFAADLMRRIEIPFEVATIRAGSYSNGVSSGAVHIGSVSMPLSDRNVLVVEDIIDSGLTINAICRRFKNLTESMDIVTLLQRGNMKELPPSQLGGHGLTRNKGLARWTGFTIPDGFVYGYGLDDVDGTGRGLLDIWMRVESPNVHVNSELAKASLKHLKMK